MIYQCFFNLHNCTFNNRYMHQPNLARCLTTMTYLLGDDDIITTRSSDKHDFITTFISPIASKFTIVDQHTLTLTLQVIILSRRLGQFVNCYGIISTCISVIITKQDSIPACTGRTLQVAMVSSILGHAENMYSVVSIFISLMSTKFPTMVDKHALTLPCNY